MVGYECPGWAGAKRKGNEMETTWWKNNKGMATDSLLPAGLGKIMLDVFEVNRPIGPPARWELWTGDWSGRIAEGVAGDIAGAKDAATAAARAEFTRRAELEGAAK